ncbi:unnamed protein product [Vitrella brassicaformis CCMP3155]|uniref:C3H1-type domain-containing protein n=2 Tax=Vitrella brassicaformis TaxID=1169539 RepID=A0A0G4EPA1_VITBC|nr:unnamed protein product [Vitrella brassicaformis CCMP3155]|eukprot:CEL98788.1 unnamed protein product [Vitrella brassicaformis CCMP3155]
MVLRQHPTAYLYTLDSYASKAAAAAASSFPVHSAADGLTPLVNMSSYEAGAAAGRTIAQQPFPTDDTPHYHYFVERSLFPSTSPFMQRRSVSLDHTQQVPPQLPLDRESAPSPSPSPLSPTPVAVSAAVSSRTIASEASSNEEVFSPPAMGGLFGLRAGGLSGNNGLPGEGPRCEEGLLSGVDGTEGEDDDDVVQELVVALSTGALSPNLRITPKLISRIPRDDNGNLLSVGSMAPLHDEGICKPCAFVHTKGCRNGFLCLFCHHPHAKRKKNRRRERESDQENAQKHVKEQLELARLFSAMDISPALPFHSSSPTHDHKEPSSPSPSPSPSLGSAWDASTGLSAVCNKAEDRPVPLSDIWKRPLTGTDAQTTPLASKDESSRLSPSGVRQQRGAGGDLGGRGSSVWAFPDLFSSAHGREEGGG